VPKADIGTLVVYNTRFNPTADGGLHLGHYFIARINECIAHSSGGKFAVRFDDFQWYYRRTIGVTAIAAYVEGIQMDLEWLGIHPDSVVYASQEEAAINAEIEYLRMGLHPEGDCMNMSSATPIREVFRYADTQSLSDTNFYPFAPYLTVHAVVSDHRLGVNAVVTSFDLLSRYSLYCWFCQVLRFPQVKHVFLPRIANEDGSSMAKSQGSRSIQELRMQGWSRYQIDDVVRKTCLTNPDGEWDISNVKRGFQLCL
jgi:glutamyl/glutaminyl-tRNA synthetase